MSADASDSSQSSDSNSAPPGNRVLPPSEMASYSSLFQRLLDPTFLLDYDTFVIREVNDSCEKVLGFALDRFPGTQLTQWVEKEYAEEIEKSLRRARRKYYPFEVELRMKAMDGKLIVAMAGCCALSLTDQSQVIQIVVKDITKQYDAEQKAARYAEDLRQANQKLAEQSITDEMTQLANFRHFKTQLVAQHDRSVRFSSPYAIVFMDLDNFKHYNDHNGHPAGDALLKGIAVILKASSRVSDLPARYGGEEFVVLCPGVTAKQAMVLAERIRTRIEMTAFPHFDKQPLGKVSASIGIAGFPEHGDNAEDILRKADEAMYVSKESGRNRITVSPGPKTGSKK